MILGCLLGNSSLQYGLFDARVDEGSLESVGRIAWSELGERSVELTPLFSNSNVEEAVIGSVRDDLLPVLERHLPSRLRRLVVGRDFQLCIENCYERPEQVGIDRLLNALAASRRAAGRGAIVVDFGTTVSVSVVSPKGAFLGGAIAPGLNSGTAGLAAATPRLPSVELREPPAFLGRTTEAGLQVGLYWQSVGGIARILRGIVSELPFVPCVYGTGGDALLFAPAIDEIDEIVPELTLQGLRTAYIERRGKVPRNDA